MTMEQPTVSEGEQKIINNNEVLHTRPVEVTSSENEQDKKEVKEQKGVGNKEQIEELKEKIMQQYGGQETKEEFPEGHILNSKTLDKIAQLEAIDPDTLEFNQARYDDYINKQAQLGAYSVGENQKVVKRNMDAGRKAERMFSRTEVIYGQGGWNRYAINPLDGGVTLSRGSSNTTGSPEYKAKLAQKAKELGLKVEGQE